MKLYKVDIKDNYSRGRYGKEVYFTITVHAKSKKAAESYAEDILRTMSYKDFFSRCTSDAYRTDKMQRFFMAGIERIDRDERIAYRYVSRCLEDKIAADHKFTVKAKKEQA